MSVLNKFKKAVANLFTFVGHLRTINSQSIRVYAVDESGKILLASGTAAYTTQNSQSVYAKGALYIKTDATTGVSGLYQNIGTAAASSFTLVEGSEGLITAVVAGAGLTGGGTDGSVTLAVGAGTGITANADDIAIAAPYLPSHVVKFAGSHAYGGGGTSSAATITGVEATDIVVASIKSKSNACYLDLVVPTTNTVTFTFSADPGASTVVYYTVFRAVA